MLAKNLAVERTADAKEASARKERKYTSPGKFLARRIAKASDQEIEQWYENQDVDYEEKLDCKTNKCLFDEACVQWTKWAPDYDLDKQRLRILWTRDRKLSIHT